ncbi:hypothetical protein [Vibrio sp. Vb0877]|nr:hypothetical protein [Vibrio sp. Vb0877]MBO0211154.1 hypothetical protein [Vibrio sp. Vb0877]MCR9808280.1 hypothetical protein [Vibrio parahaemolyticus]
MLEKLNDNQMLAVAVVSHFFHHQDPMSLIANSDTSDGVARLRFWIDTHNARITSTPINKQVGELLKSPRIELPHVEVPIHLLSKKSDMTMPDGRRSFVHSVLNHLITAQWSLDFELDALGLTSVDCNNLRSKLSTPKVTPHGTECAQQVLDKVIMPVLVEDMPATHQMH